MNAKSRTIDLQEIFIQDCRFRNLSEHTIKDYNWYLTDIKKQLGEWAEISRPKLKELVLSKLNEGQSPASANHYIRAIKAFYSFLIKEEYIESNPFAGFPLVSMPEKLKDVLEPKDISRLVAAIPDKGFFHARDKAMIILLFDTAIRLKELLHIKLDDLDMKNGLVRVFGKGRKDRIVPLGRKSKRELVKYLKLRGDNHSEYLFCTHTGYAVMPRNFRRSLDKYAQKAGLRVSPHLIRHSAATYLAKNEMPAQHIQILLGHSSLAITQNYINRIVAQEGLQNSHRRLSPADRL